MYRQYLGGNGLGAALLYREIPPGADPLGAENILGFLPGLLTGAGSLFTGRWMAVAKSPLTGTWGDSNCGGTLALAIKQCGYDGIFFKGISPAPVYLLIDAGGPKLLDARHLWGKDAIETEDWLAQKHGGKKLPAVAAIGQAGETLSLISGIVNDRGRLAARSGLGAVMGSKCLKAVVLVGSKRVVAHDPTQMKRLSEKCVQAINMPIQGIRSNLIAAYGKAVGRLPVGVNQPGLLFGSVVRKWGTIGTLPASVGLGDTPFKNWAGTYQDMPIVNDAINPEDMLRQEKRKYHCRGCPLGCGGIVRMPVGGEESHKPEYETTVSFSTLLLSQDMPLVYEINEMLNRAGMDSISAGGAVAFAMECYEKGWITREDTGGLDLTWGNAAAVRALVEEMIRREGFGARLADGVARALQNLPPQAAEAAIHAGGQEIAFHDPRVDPGMALHASVDPTPGRHTTGAQLYYNMYRLWTRVPGLPTARWVYPKQHRTQPGNGRTTCAAVISNFTQFFASAGACYTGLLIGVDRVPIFEWTNAATGWNLAPQEYLRIGQRIQTLRQMFNIRQGIDPRRIRISARLTGHPAQQSGPNRGVSYELEPLVSTYWQEMGWDAATGIPTRAVLDDLDLWDVIPAEHGGEAR